MMVSPAPVASAALGRLLGHDVRCNNHVRTAAHIRPFPTPMTNGLRLSPNDDGSVDP